MIVVVLLLTLAVGCAEQGGTVALKVGDYKLTTADLSYFYMDKVIEYRQAIYDQYYSFLGSSWTAMMGFDPSKPLNAQAYDETQTWADYFIDLSVKTARDIYVLYAAAQKANFTMTETEKSSLEAMMESLASYATYYGYDNLDGYLQMWYGSTASEASYRKYYEVCTTAYSYMNHYNASLELTMEDYKAYDREHFDDFSLVSFDYYSLQYKKYLGEGVKDENGNTTWTDEEIQAAREALAADIETLKATTITTLEEFDSALQALDVNKVEEGKTPVTAMVIEKASFNGLTLPADGNQWLKDQNRADGDFGVFPSYSYPVHEDSNHQHGENCGCEKTLESCVFILFKERDDQLTSLVNIRHILVSFSGGTTNSDGTVSYSSAEKQKAKEEAEKLYQQWKDGEMTEDSFAALANAESDDQGGKVTNGGLYERVHPGQMVKNFDAWCFDPSRQAGDTGSVETEYGYHIMYFSSVDEMTYRDKQIDYSLRAKQTESWFNALVEAMGYEIVNLSEMAYDLKLG